MNENKENIKDKSFHIYYILINDDNIMKIDFTTKLYGSFFCELNLHTGEIDDYGKKFN
jgi:hypothetical protein